MTIPYLQRVGAGLAIDDEAVRYVELVGTLGRVRLRRVEREPVGDGLPESALRRLAERIGPGPRFVHTHVPAESVRLRTLEVPAYEDPDDVARWLADHAERFRTEAEGGDAVVRSVLLGEEGEAHEGARTRTAILVVVSPADIAERVQQVRQAGFTPLRLGTGALEAASALVVGDEPVLDGSVLVAGAARSFDVRLREGQVEAVRVLDAPPEVAVEERRHAVDVRYDGSDLLYVTGPHAPAAVRAGRDAGQPVAPAAPFGGRHPELEPGDALAAGLAVEVLFPGLALVDVLDKAERRAGAEAAAKREALRAILALCVVVLVVLGVAQAATWYFSGRLGATEAALLDQAEERAEAERLRRDLGRLRRDVAAAREAAAERTPAARLYEAVGRALPPGVWLVEYAWDDDAGTASVTAYAQGMAGVEAYLAGLERLEAFGRVELLYSERVEPEVVERNAGERRALVRFGVQLVEN